MSPYPASPVAAANITTKGGQGGGGKKTTTRKSQKRTNGWTHRNREDRSVLVVASLDHLHGTAAKFQYRPDDGDADDWARRYDGRAARSTLGTGAGYEELVCEEQ